MRLRRRRRSFGRSRRRVLRGRRRRRIGPMRIGFRM